MFVEGNLDLVPPESETAADPALEWKLARINARYNRRRVHATRRLVRRAGASAIKTLSIIAEHPLTRSQLDHETSGEILAEIAAISTKAEAADLDPQTAESLVQGCIAVQDRISSLWKPVLDADNERIIVFVYPREGLHDLSVMSLGF